MADDFQAAFRAAKDQRGLAAKPTKEQLRAAKAKQAAARAAAQQPAPAAAAPPPLLAPRQQQPPQPAGAVPAGFFDGPQAAVPKQQLAGSKRPGPSLEGGGRGAAAEAAVPKGFFDDKSADNLARGIKAPDKKDKDAAFVEFAAAMEDELKQQAAAEDEEAEEAAQERAEREEHEQQLRVQRAAELRALKARPTLAREAIEVDADIAAAAAAASKKRRVVDVLQAMLGSDDDDDEGSEDDGDDLDWRAKAATK